MLPSNNRGGIPSVHTSRPGGFSCCCCQCCPCINLSVLRNPIGLIKLSELILGFICQSLALTYGTEFSGAIGPSFQSFINTVSWCLMTSFLLLVCYVFSQKSIRLLKQSLFETIFNSIAAFSYLTSCSYLGYVVNIFLQPTYLSPSYAHVYPAMSAAYMLGSFLGVIYGYDAYQSYKYFKGYR